MKYLKYLYTIIILISTLNSFAQDETSKPSYRSDILINMDLRLRSEYLHGYQNPALETDMYGYKYKPEIYTAQRSRINIDYKAYDHIRFFVSMQDIRLWGNTPQLFTNNGNTFSFQQAWTQLIFNEQISLKIGRMELDYERSRLLGNEDWLNQARTHDIAVFELKGLFNLDIGIANNFDYENKKQYLIQNSYKYMQFFHLNYDIGPFGISSIFINNGIPEKSYSYDYNNDEIIFVKEKAVYSQTFGGRFDFYKKPFFAEINTYFQKGRHAADWIYTDSLAAHGITLDEFNTLKTTNYKSLKNNGQSIDASYIRASAGIEYKDFKFEFMYEKLSGNDYDDNGLDTDKIDNAFIPMYGSNHNFNGAMDYFYSPYGTQQGFIQNIGLQDISLNIEFDNFKFFSSLKTHYFFAANKAKYTDTNGQLQDIKDLGIEIDFTLGYRIVENVTTIKLGYSHILPTEGFAALKGMDYESFITNNWAWISFIYTPELFKSN